MAEASRLADLRCRQQTRYESHVVLSPGAYLYLPSFRQGGYYFALRGASVFAKQSLLLATPDRFRVLRHGNGDWVGVYAVRDHRRVLVHARDSILSSVVLLLAPVSVLQGEREVRGEQKRKMTER